MAETPDRNVMGAYFAGINKGLEWFMRQLMKYLSEAVPNYNGLVAGNYNTVPEGANYNIGMDSGPGYLEQLLGGQQHRDDAYSIDGAAQPAYSSLKY